VTEQPSAEEAAQWRRRFAAGANNRSWTLAEQVSRTPAEDAEMLHAAHASRYLWGPIGTEKNLATADLLLGQVHALLGLGQTAMPYAQSAFEYFTSHPSETGELAFAHAVRAHAAHAAGRHDLHRESHAKALELADALANPVDRKIFDATFDLIPKPAPGPRSV
jgi:hypothetical protein